MAVDADSRTRKWQIIINNPNEKGYSHDWLKQILSGLNQVVYWCMADEIGECGTYHTHLYVAFKQAIRFSTIKKKFEGGHFEMCRGTSQENRDYIFKEGKWEKDKKGETHLKDTREEYGQMPIERPGARNDLADLYDMIKQGMSNYEIMEVCPQYLFNVDKIERVRQMYREEKYKSTFRQLEVTYVYGQTGTGKTRNIMEEYGYENVYRITAYDHPFDGYNGQDVIVFEEFRSSLKIQDMLNYLDGYPLELPCRYSNKVACFTKAYLVTNLALEKQCESIQREYMETWEAFIRRINLVKEYRNGDIFERTIEQEIWWQDGKDKITNKNKYYRTEEVYTIPHVLK